MMTNRRSQARAWAKEYGKATFLAPDFLLACAAAVGVGVMTSLHREARLAGDDFLGLAAGVDAGLLGLILAAMTVVIAFVNRTFVLIVGDVHRALMPFTTLAVIAAAALTACLAADLAFDTLVWQGRVALLALASGLTAWTVFGTVQLVFLAAFFARVRAEELSILEDTDRLRQARAEQLRKAR